MIQIPRRSIVLASAVCLLSCRDPGAPCQSNSECRDNELCVEQICHVVCTSNQQCARTDVCRDGICWPAEPTSDAAGPADGSGPDADRADRTAADSAHDAGRPDQAAADHVDASTSDASSDVTAPDIPTADARWSDARVDDARVADAAVCSKPALSFDGVDDYLEVPDSTAFDGLSALTVEAWVNTLATIAAGTRLRIVSHHRPGPYEGYSLTIYDGSASFMIGHGAGYSAARSGFAQDPFPAGSWHHVAGSWDGTSVRIFVDGRLQATTASASGPLDYVGPMTVGLGAGDRGFPFVGLIDEVRVSRIARYTADFAAPTAPLINDPDTIVLWHLNEGTGQSVADSSGHGHQASLGAATSVDNQDPQWVSTACIADRL